MYLKETTKCLSIPFKAGPTLRKFSKTTLNGQDRLKIGRSLRVYEVQLGCGLMKARSPGLNYVFDKLNRQLINGGPTQFTSAHRIIFKQPFTLFSHVV